MSRLSKTLVAVMQGVLISITVAVMLVTFFVSLPMLETRYKPVVSKLAIGKVEPASDGRSIVYAAFNKLRQCEYIGIAWYQRQSDGSLERVPLELLRRPGDISSPNRPLGRAQSGPWIVSIPVNQLRQSSVVELTHRCHPFWTSVTQFYP